MPISGIPNSANHKTLVPVEFDQPLENPPKYVSPYYTTGPQLVDDRWKSESRETQCARANEVVSGVYTRENMPGYAGAVDDYLPPMGELEYPEVQLTTGSLLAGAHFFGKYCDHPSKVLRPTHSYILLHPGAPVAYCLLLFTTT